MNRISKSSAVFFILIMAVSSLSLIMVKPTFAQTVSKPSIPEFTVKYVDSSYDVPATTSINQYTGKTVTNQGYHVENETLQLTIKNQPFTSYIDNGQNISFYYNVREKGDFSGHWIDFYSPDNGYPTESRGDYTTITFVLGNYSIFGYTPPNSKIDFQVQALIGSVHRISNITAGNQFPWELFPWIFDGQTSDWSNTQTVTVYAYSSSPTPTSSLTPTVPEFPSWIIPLLVSMMLATAGLLVYHKKHKH
jgi:hypothetical protein